MAADSYLNFDFVSLDRYATSEYLLDKGAFGSVHGPIPLQGMQLAIKQVMFADGKVTDEFKKDIEAKKTIWTSLEHKQLMRIYSVDLRQLPRAMFIVMEFAPGGSLYKTLRSLGSGDKLSIDVITDWSKQIAEGMLYLHQQSIVHRDLKSSNILLMEIFNMCIPHMKITLEISDFDDIKEHDHTTTMSGLVGTCAYMAPEVLGNQQFSKASDVWSYGVVIWELLSGDVPYKGVGLIKMISDSNSGKLAKLPLEQSFPDGYRQLLSKCWESTYEKRPSFNDISCILERMVGKSDAPKDVAIVKEFALADTEHSDELPEKYQSDPVLIMTVRTKGADEEQILVRGLTILDKELFIVSERSSKVEVYYSIELNFRRRFKLKKLIDPMDIVSCNRNKCLYIFDHKATHKSKEILRVDPSGKLIKRWSTGDNYGYGLSVTDESNVILAVYNKNKLNEYSPDGQLIREINLSSDANCSSPWHAVKLTNNNHFVVSHGSSDDDLHRVCIVNAEGKMMSSFGGRRGSTKGQINCPVYLSVDGNGFVLVVDKWNNRVLLLDSNLDFKTEILGKEKLGLRHPWRVLLDDSNDRLLVDDPSTLCDGGQISIFQFCY